VDQTFCTEHNEYGVDIQPITIKHKNNIPHQESELYNQLQLNLKNKIYNYYVWFYYNPDDIFFVSLKSLEYVF
jgi:hypothetical protein